MSQNSEFSELLAPIRRFLLCPTPSAWLKQCERPEVLEQLLVDHANCELKAAQTAVWLMRRYATDKHGGEVLLEWLKPYEDYVYRRVALSPKTHAPSKRTLTQSNSAQSDDMIDRLVLLVKEELHHFHQVIEILAARGIEYHQVTASRYAKGLMKHVRTYEPATLIDKLICGAYIEARSCERFAALIPYVDDELGRFYLSLLRSEARHFEDYLTMAKAIAGESIEGRVREFGQWEADLITSPDPQVRFHSGIPEAS